jgi:uncharacterized protein (DUF2164 family)
VRRQARWSWEYDYNRGLYDAQAALVAKLDDIQDAIYQLERPTDFKR